MTVTLHYSALQQKKLMYVRKKKLKKFTTHAPELS